MLKPPLSLLPDEILVYIVDHVARLPFQRDECLCNLSITDHAFTHLCQSHIFRTFKLVHDWGKKRTSRKILKLGKIMNDRPLLAGQVRVVDLSLSHNDNGWLFNDLPFVCILQMLDRSPAPPHELRFSALNTYTLSRIESPGVVVGRLMESFFSRTLTTLHLTRCTNIPLPLFLVCPGLKEVVLDHVETTEKTYDMYPDNQCLVREAPALELFNYRDSASLVKQMISPPPRFCAPVVLWSKLRVLTLSPHEGEEMNCLQPILDEAWESLEELYLTTLHDTMGKAKQLPLANLVNLSNIPKLRIFALYAIVKCDAKWSWVLDDINTVLHSIPASNQITDLSFDLTISGADSLDGCLDQDWRGLCNEVIRISAGKPLELELHTKVSTGGPGCDKLGRAELLASVMQKIGSLSNYPSICAHFWNPVYWGHGLGPSTSGRSMVVHYPTDPSTLPMPKTCMKHSTSSSFLVQKHFQF